MEASTEVPMDLPVVRKNTARPHTCAGNLPLLPRKLPPLPLPLLPHDLHASFRYFHGSYHGFLGSVHCLHGSFRRFQSNTKNPCSPRNYFVEGTRRHIYTNKRCHFPTIPLWSTRPWTHHRRWRLLPYKTTSFRPLTY